MESRKGYTSIGHGRLEASSSSLQLAEALHRSIFTDSLFFYRYKTGYIVLVTWSYWLVKLILWLYAGFGFWNVLFREMHNIHICWRPYGKAIAVGLEDGAVSLHDVEVSSFVLYIYVWFFIKVVFVSIAPQLSKVIFVSSGHQFTFNITFEIGFIASIYLFGCTIWKVEQQISEKYKVPQCFCRLPQLGGR